jgi:DNA-binding HxlR family transcriptional regulator
MKKKALKKANISLTPEEFCPTRQSIRILGKQWTLLIIKELYYARYMRLSFMDLSKKLKDSSSKVLSERLKEMAEDGIVRRKVVPDTNPPRVFYYLTKKGQDACHIIEAFKDYGIRWGSKDKTFDCKRVDCELCTKDRDAGKVPAHHQRTFEQLSPFASHSAA